MKNITVLGIDLAKDVFQLHGVNEKNIKKNKKNIKNVKNCKLIVIIVQLFNYCVHGRENGQLIRKKYP